MDTKLGYMRLPLEVHGAEIAQRRVPACRVVEALDIIEHVRLRVIARSICLPADPFGLHRREETLHWRVVPDVARPAHRAGDAIVGHQPLELLARVLAALVRVMQQGVGFSASPDRHHQRIGHELSGHRVAHRPSDHAAREQVDDGSDVEPPAIGTPGGSAPGKPGA